MHWVKELHERRGSILIMCAGLLLLFTVEAVAQRPFAIHDPFYRGESAQRAFYDGVAVTAEIAYRPMSLLGGTTLSAGDRSFGAASFAQTARPTGGTSVTSPEALVVSTNAVGLAFQLDYEIAPQMDLSAIVDATGGLDGQSVAISWLVLKHYMHDDGVDYAFRLAVDPFSDPGVGFRQTDVAFLSSSALSALISTDFAVGWRRVRVSNDFWLPTELASQQAAPDRLLRKAFGQELHLMMSYRLIFDPAESHIFLSMVNEAGKYDLLEIAISGRPDEQANRRTGEFLGGTLWVRTGFQWNRPSYQMAPFVNLPLLSWGEEEENWYERKNGPNFGLRLTIR